VKARHHLSTAARAIESLCAIVAVVAWVCAGLCAWRYVSQAFDVWYYHVPFAARIVGIVPAADFSFSAVNEARYAGYPLLGEALQGLCYWASGRPEAVNLPAFVATLLFAVFLWKRCELPFGVASLALLGIPLVQTHITSAYVDLPANLAITAAAILLLPTIKHPRRARRRDVYWAVALLATAANMRFQLCPVALVLLTVWWRVAKRQKRGRHVMLAAPLVFFSPLKNLLLHGNPAYPVALRVLGHALPAAEPQYAGKPLTFAHTPEPILWLRSVLEMDAHPLGDSSRWSVDQYADATDAASRMGGFNGYYVAAAGAASLFAVALGAAAGHRRVEWRCGALLAAATLLAALSPQAHELRYYPYWMLLLVTVTLMHLANYRVARALLALAAFGMMTLTTGGDWLRPTGTTFTELLAKHAPEQRIPALKATLRICVTRPPYNWLYAPQLHPKSGRYFVFEGEEDSESPCGDSTTYRIAQ
jgi:hypothetical protein